MDDFQANLAMKTEYDKSTKSLNLIYASVLLNLESRNPSSTTRKNEPSGKVGPHDVLLGRGGATNSHVGNRIFRCIVASYQKEYLAARKKDKKGIAQLIVAKVQNNGGRFLERVDDNENWIEVKSTRALAKASQALREGLDVRNGTVRPSKLIKEMQPPKVMKQNPSMQGSGNSSSENVPQFMKKSSTNICCEFPNI